MKTSISAMAIGALVMLPASPVMALSASQMPKLPPGGLAALKAVKAKCHELVAPYKDGMLKGKIVIDDEPVTKEMLSNDDYPSAPQAVISRQFLAAAAKCESRQLKFLKKYAPWDLPTANFLADSEKPVYIALTLRQITFGTANRNLAHIMAEATAMQERNWPKVAAAQAARGGGSAPVGGDIGAAYKDMTAKCAALNAPFRNGVLSGKLVIAGQSFTPAALANSDVPDDTEAQAVRDYAAARRLCDAYQSRYATTYRPWLKPVMDKMIKQQQEVYSALIGRQISFGAANKKLQDINIKGGTAADAIVKQRAGGGNSAGSQDTSKMQSERQLLQPPPGP